MLVICYHFVKMHSAINLLNLIPENPNAADAVIAATFLSLNVDKKGLLGLVSGGINAMFDNPSDPFFTGRMMDIAFDGIPINCATDHMIAKRMCATFADGSRQAIRKIDDQHFAFSLFGGVRTSKIQLYDIALNQLSQRIVSDQSFRFGHVHRVPRQKS